MSFKSGRPTPNRGGLLWWVASPAVGCVSCGGLRLRVPGVYDWSTPSEFSPGFGKGVRFHPGGCVFWLLCQDPWTRRWLSQVPISPAFPWDGSSWLRSPGPKSLPPSRTHTFSYFLNTVNLRWGIRFFSIVFCAFFPDEMCSPRLPPTRVGTTGIFTINDPDTTEVY